MIEALLVTIGSLVGFTLMLYLNEPPNISKKYKIRSGWCVPWKIEKYRGRYYIHPHVKLNKTMYGTSNMYVEMRVEYHAVVSPSTDLSNLETDYLSDDLIECRVLR